jgi:hypothetical protein
MLLAERLNFLLEALQNFISFLFAELVPKHLAILRELRFMAAAGEQQLDVGRDDGGQPELRFYASALGVKAEIDAFEDNDHFGFLLCLIA